MLSRRIFNFIRYITRTHVTLAGRRTRNFRIPIALGIFSAAKCDNIFDDSSSANTLEHEFLIKQATTVNVNAATQLLTVTLVAIQDTSER